MEKRVELTKEAWQSCTDKPSVKLMALLEEASEGDVITIIGEEDFAPSFLVEKIVERWEVEVLERESDGYSYKLVVRKR